MKKGDLIYTDTAVRLGGKLVAPGETLTVGPDLPAKTAERFVAVGAAHRVVSDEGIDVEALAQTPDLASLKVDQLKLVAGYYDADIAGLKTKADIVEAVTAARDGADEDDEPNVLDLDAMSIDDLRDLADELGVPYTDDDTAEALRTAIDEAHGE